jgi:IstB-like ATP binding protein
MQRFLCHLRARCTMIDTAPAAVSKLVARFRRRRVPRVVTRLATATLSMATLRKGRAPGTSCGSVIADAVLDRLLHQAHRLTLKGESLRRSKPAKARADQSPIVTD